MADLPPANRSAPAARILVVGTGAPRPSVDGMTCVALADLTPTLLAATRPDIILSALFLGIADATDVASRLAALDYRGRYRVITDEPLPFPAVVLADLRAAAPGLDIDLMTLPHA
jgi:hypothetical protein